MRRGYTNVQQASVNDFKDAYKDLMNDPRRRGQYAVVDVSRTPTSRTAWGNKSQLKPDMVECLTASGPLLHVFALGAWLVAAQKK